MPGDLELLPARVLRAAPGIGPAAVAAELLGRVRAELPVIGELGERDQVLVSAWLTGLRSAHPPRLTLRRAAGPDIVVSREKTLVAAQALAGVDRLKTRKGSP